MNVKLISIARGSPLYFFSWTLMYLSFVVLTYVSRSSSLTSFEEAQQLEAGESSSIFPLHAAWVGTICAAICLAATLFIDLCLSECHEDHQHIEHLDDAVEATKELEELEETMSIFSSLEHAALRRRITRIRLGLTPRVSQFEDISWRWPFPVIVFGVVSMALCGTSEFIGSFFICFTLIDLLLCNDVSEGVVLSPQVFTMNLFVTIITHLVLFVAGGTAMRNWGNIAPSKYPLLFVVFTSVLTYPCYVAKVRYRALWFRSPEDWTDFKKGQNVLPQTITVVETPPQLLSSTNAAGAGRIHEGFTPLSANDESEAPIRGSESMRHSLKTVSNWSHTFPSGIPGGVPSTSASSPGLGGERLGVNTSNSHSLRSDPPTSAATNQQQAHHQHQVSNLNNNSLATMSAESRKASTPLGRGDEAVTSSGEGQTGSTISPQVPGGPPSLFEVAVPPPAAQEYPREVKSKSPTSATKPPLAESISRNKFTVASASLSARPKELLQQGPTTQATGTPSLNSTGGGALDNSISAVSLDKQPSLFSVMDPNDPGGDPMSMMLSTASTRQQLLGQSASLGHRPLSSTPSMGSIKTPKTYMEMGKEERDERLKSKCSSNSKLLVTSRQSGSGDDGRSEAINDESRDTALAAAADATEVTGPKVAFKLGNVIGSGAHGVVHLALIEETAETVCAKQIHFVGLAETEVEKQLERAKTEVQLLKTLDHPNIVRYFFTEKYTPTDSGSTSLLIFMEYVSGGSLEGYIKQFGKLDERTCAIFAAQLLLGIEYLHAKKITHRDVKPGNCLCATNGVVKLSDFGTAWMHEDLDSPTATDRSGKEPSSPIITTTKTAPTNNKGQQESEPEASPSLLNPFSAEARREHQGDQNLNASGEENPPSTKNSRNGSSTQDSGCGRRSAPSDLTGTPYYMAPEIIKSEGCDSSADIWAFGCTLMEMLTGKNPWAHISENAFKILSEVARATGDDDLPLPDDISPLATSLLKKCLFIDPNRRWPAALLLRDPFFAQYDILQKSQSASLEKYPETNVSSPTFTTTTTAGSSQQHANATGPQLPPSSALDVHHPPLEMLSVSSALSSLTGSEYHGAAKGTTEPGSLAMGKGISKHQKQKLQAVLQGSLSLKPNATGEMMQSMSAVSMSQFPQYMVQSPGSTIQAAKRASMMQLKTDLQNDF